MAIGDALIDAHALSKTYGSNVAVDSIDLKIHAGEVFGLLGPNGAGKTTTVLMLLGLSEPDGGTVRVVGLDPTRHPLAVKRRVGYLPDTVGFYEDMTGRQNLRFTAAINELNGNDAERRIAHLLQLVGLADDADRMVQEYSRGMRQRLGLADCLVKDPLVVILDEPLVGIDPEGVTEMQGLITRLAKDDGRAVLLTSHMLPQVQQTCDRIAIFVNGQVIAEGTPADLAAGLGDGHASFELVTPAGESEISSVLRGLAGADFELLPIGSSRWKVALPGERSSDLVPALVHAGIGIRELRDLGSELEEIYHRYFKVRDAEVSA